METVGVWTGVFLTMWTVSFLVASIKNHVLLTKLEKQISGMVRQVGDKDEM